MIRTALDPRIWSALWTGLRVMSRSGQRYELPGHVIAFYPQSGTRPLSLIKISCNPKMNDLQLIAWLVFP
jgi:hypothetical protein